MAKQATNIRLFTAEQIPHPGANQQKANARPWEQVQLKMPDKRPGGGWAAMELIETLPYRGTIPFCLHILPSYCALKASKYVSVCWPTGGPDVY